jgi:hypothetical protein
VLGADHPGTITAREMLAIALYDQRRLREAATEYGEVLALRATTLGGHHPDTKRARRWHTRIQTALQGPDQSSSTV